jgi:hypothetical protein
MASSLFIWLGSGRARRRGVGEKGMLLDQAARAGLPVPTGAILLDELRLVFLDKGLIEARNGRLIAPDPELLHNTLFYSVRLPRFARAVALRPAFAASPAVPARLSVDLGDAVATAAALAALWSGAEAQPPGGRADLLVMEMVAAQAAGAALTNSTAAARGALADEITLRSGDEAPLSTLPRLTGWQAPDPTLPPFARRLQMLLRGARRTFGPGVWQIEWIDDGQICYLVTATKSAAP